MKIALIGYRGTGKSTVAKELATALDCAYVDSDDQVELATSKTIAEVFADDGESHFRDLETAVLQELCKQTDTVLSLGGGAVIRSENRKMLAKLDHVVWLQADPETIYNRLSTDENTPDRRPNLTVAGGRREIEEVLAERTPLYRECATLEVDTFDKSPAEVAREILAFLAHS